MASDVNGCDARRRTVKHPAFRDLDPATKFLYTPRTISGLIIGTFSLNSPSPGTHFHKLLLLLSLCVPSVWLVYCWPRNGIFVTHAPFQDSLVHFPLTSLCCRRLYWLECSGLVYSFILRGESDTLYVIGKPDYWQQQIQLGVCIAVSLTKQLWFSCLNNCRGIWGFPSVVGRNIHLDAVS